MSKQTINNTDVSPDSLYTAADKINSNFTELYSADTTLSGLITTETSNRIAADALKENIFDPATKAYFYEDFVSGQVNGLSGSSSLFDHYCQTSGDTGAAFTRALTEDGWGILKLTTGALLNRIAYIQNLAGSANELGLRNMSGVTYKVRVKPVTTTSSVEYYLGFNGDGNNVGRDGIYFTRTTGNWILNCSAAGVASTADTGVAPSADTWQTLSFVVNAAGTSVQAYINGTIAGSAITSHIPTVGVFSYAQIKTTDVGNVAKSMSLDYVYYKKDFTR